jgi:phosphoribosyl 1,2-cyclic phosphate phosphodiesterase
MNVSLLVLGSGTSQGVPAIGCDCETCTSSDARDTRLRPSVLIEADGIRLLIDTSSDFRAQMLRHNIRRIDAVLYTHAHFDHIGGFDDLRQYNFLQNAPMRVFGARDTIEAVRGTFRYAFGAATQEGGGLPRVITNEIEAARPFRVDGIEITPVPVLHGQLPILGYRVGDVAYLTDTSGIPESSIALLRNLDVLVLDALRHREHPTHFSLRQAVEAAERIGARRTYFTHIAHNILHERDSALLPESMEFSYDTLLINSPTERS